MKPKKFAIFIPEEAHKKLTERCFKEGVQISIKIQKLINDWLNNTLFRCNPLYLNKITNRFKAPIEEPLNFNSKISLIAKIEDLQHENKVLRTIVKENEKELDQEIDEKLKNFYKGVIGE